MPIFLRVYLHWGVDVATYGWGDIRAWPSRLLQEHSGLRQAALFGVGGGILFEGGPHAGGAVVPVALVPDLVLLEVLYLLANPLGRMLLTTPCQDSRGRTQGRCTQTGPRNKARAGSAWTKRQLSDRNPAILEKDAISGRSGTSMCLSGEKFVPMVRPGLRHVTMLRPPTTRPPLFSFGDQAPASGNLGERTPV